MHTATPPFQAVPCGVIDTERSELNEVQLLAPPMSTFGLHNIHL